MYFYEKKLKVSKFQSELLELLAKFDSLKLKFYICWKYFICTYISYVLLFQIRMNLYFEYC